MKDSAEIHSATQKRLYSLLVSSRNERVQSPLNETKLKIIIVLVIRFEVIYRQWEENVGYAGVC